MTRPYAHDEWRLVETRLSPAHNLLSETLFALGNGRIGLRGVQDEGCSSLPNDQWLAGCYLNGFHDTLPIRYPENAYGLARSNQFMLRVPNGLRVELWLGDERLDLLQGELLHYERSLDFRTGVLRRELRWRSPKGRTVQLVSERLASFTRPEVYAQRTQVQALDDEAPLLLVSSLNGRIQNLEAGDDPRVGTHTDGPSLLPVDASQTHTGSWMLQRTRGSGQRLLSMIEHEVRGFDSVMREALAQGSLLTHRYGATLVPRRVLELTKYGTYATGDADLLSQAQATLQSAKEAGFTQLLREQAEYLAAHWRDADVQISGDVALQQGLRFNLFHLLQSVGRDGRTNIAAKGLTGEGYEGHTFWDTEVYVLPAFVHTRPEIARSLLLHRWRGLPAARQRAREMAHPKGALYPWRTIAGEECSAYFPAGTAQYHINADIAHAVKLYAEATGDRTFLLAQGAEMVMETARIWLHLGAHDARRGGAFCIHEVTGPDEYTAMVSNNFYTNAMAQQHLAYAAELAQWLMVEHPAEFQRISEAMQLEPSEPLHWLRAAERMHLPVDPELGVHPQDDGFLHKPRWDFANTPADRYPLLLHYHPLVIYRHQVCKQADVVLALLLLHDRFTLEQKRRDFDYYEPLTTHDSSLSPCIFGILAAELGEADKALDYFMRTVRMDLDDVHGNSGHGVHTAAMAGSWLGLVQGFAGLRLHRGRARLRPQLPAGWQGYRFRLKLQDAQLEVDVSTEGVAYRLVAGKLLEIHHHDELLRLTPRRRTLVRPLHRDTVLEVAA